MKKLFAILGAVAMSTAIFAQGTINFNNRVTPVLDAPVFRPDGSPAGAGVTAQLYLVSGSTFSPIGQSTTFRAPTAANPLLAAYVNPINPMQVQGQAPGTTIQVVMRIWEGASYDAAAAGGLFFGQSNPISVLLGGDIPGQPQAVAGNLIGLEFPIIPEPSTIAIGILGAAALLYRRRS